ncbi:hypothetical protein BCT56_03390 [Vibrio lentus]|uniref:Transposase n=2 Tax=Vibrio lentus TaxID=136468 RepID=A0AB36XFR0_9VIBR|nr:hypothetical protein BCU51_08610 [Vibrio lentus]PMK29713.1 hypothetical protein BCU02_05095 [Vibrio lentus]PMK39427.1 hypothetical protein BCT99_07530 [Vibrio lentus]PML29347.1 hypothetical protein BCT79_05810 [Vibrio lentus]PMM41480.1 hypothetical protein BCT56_03390 [Vibrio lentus]
MVEVSVITLKLEVKRPVVEIMKALTDSLHAMKLFHEIIVYIIKMTFDYLPVRSNKYTKIHFLKRHLLMNPQLKAIYTGKVALLFQWPFEIV